MVGIKRFILLHIVINAFFISWTYAKNVKEDHDESENWVKVEKQFIVDDEKDSKKSRFLSFKERRPSWGFRIALSLEKSESDINYPVSTLQKAKIKSKSMDFGLQTMASYNLPLISVGAGINLGLYNFKGGVKALKTGADLHAIADGIFNNPYVAPYGKIGIGRYSFENPSSSDVLKHDSKLSFYYTLGGLLLLDWLQKTMSMEAFYNYGLEGSFIFFEMEDFPSLASAKSSLFPDKFKTRSFKVGLHLVF
ncbi:MAG: hypothetical protein M9899_01125 [Bdellovibrionaceae bacterium]|nr:hypothetical protein [Pseudobdellovibrionaceae bacterium]